MDYGSRILLIRPGKNAIENCGIFYTTAHRTRGVQGMAEGKNPVSADSADTGFQSGQPAPGGRNANRPAGIGTDAPWRKSCCNGRGSPCAGTSGGTVFLKIPRIFWGSHMLVGTKTPHGEFDGVGFPQNDHSSFDHPANQGRCQGRAAILPYHRAPGGDFPLNVNDVFDRNRDALQWSDDVSTGSCHV